MKIPYSNYETVPYWLATEPHPYGTLEVFMVLQRILKFAKHKGRDNITCRYSRIAEKSALDRKTVIRVVHFLRDIKILTVTPTRTSRGNGANCYSFDYNKIEEKSKKQTVPNRDSPPPPIGTHLVPNRDSPSPQKGLRSKRVSNKRVISQSVCVVRESPPKVVAQNTPHTELQNNSINDLKGQNQGKETDTFTALSTFTSTPSVLALKEELPGLSKFDSIHQAIDPPKMPRHEDEAAGELLSLVRHVKQTFGRHPKGLKPPSGYDIQIGVWLTEGYSEDDIQESFDLAWQHKFSKAHYVLIEFFKRVMEEDYLRDARETRAVAAGQTEQLVAFSDRYRGCEDGELIELFEKIDSGTKTGKIIFLFNLFSPDCLRKAEKFSLDMSVPDLLPRYAQELDELIEGKFAEQFPTATKYLKPSPSFSATLV